MACDAVIEFASRSRNLFRSRVPAGCYAQSLGKFALHQFRQKLYWDRPIAQHSLMVTAEVEFRTQLRLHLLPQTNHCHAAGKLSAELNGCLLGAHQFLGRFFLALKGAIDHQAQGLVIAHIGAVELVVENRISHGTQVEL
jgi:hypothetical protein